MSHETPEPFHIVEYRALRDEMLTKLNQISQLYNFFFVSVFATIAWLLTYAERLDPVASIAAAWIPFLVTHYFAAYRKDHSDSIHGIGDYLTTLENRYAESGLGWQRTVRLKDGKRVKVYWRTRTIFLQVRIATIVFAIYYMIDYGRLLERLDFVVLIQRLFVR